MGDEESLLESVLAFVLNVAEAHCGVAGRASGYTMRKGVLGFGVRAARSALLLNLARLLA